MLAIKKARTQAFNKAVIEEGSKKARNEKATKPQLRKKKLRNKL